MDKKIQWPILIKCIDETHVLMKEHKESKVSDDKIQSTERMYKDDT